MYCTVAKVRQDYSTPATGWELGSPTLYTRADLQYVASTLLTATVTRLSRYGSRLSVTGNSAHFSPDVAGLEGYSRLLWGLAPLISGCGAFDHTDRVIEGLVVGTNPDHPEFWGLPFDYDPRIVAAAAIAYALCTAAPQMWNPLSRLEKDRVLVWLEAASRCSVYDNNWRFFRVLINIALRVIGGRDHRERINEDMDRLISFHVGDGWYSDGPAGTRDYYNSFVMHYYGLLCTSITNAVDREHAAVFHKHAQLFANQFIQWFSPDGSAVPYGRSLVYRMAQAAFWSALPVANLEALPWGVIKGIVMRHIRWWLRQEIYSSEGQLSVGYTYANTSFVEPYVSPASPYWAFKIFSVLAVSAAHPFWSCEEALLPPLPQTHSQRVPGVIVCRHGNHVYAIAAGQVASARARFATEKYSKLCYSNMFAFSVPTATHRIEFLCPDSALLIGSDPERMYGRELLLHSEVTDVYILSQWQPFTGVEITTWLIPAMPWHVRVHRVFNIETIYSVEGAFAVDLMNEERVPNSTPIPRTAKAQNGESVAIIKDLLANRMPHVIRAAPNSNLRAGRTLIPALSGTHAPGTHWIASAVLGGACEELGDLGGDSFCPVCRLRDDVLIVEDHQRAELLRIACA